MRDICTGGVLPQLAGTQPILKWALKWNGKLFIPSSEEMAKPQPSSLDLAHMSAKLKSEIISSNESMYLKNKHNAQVVFPAALDKMLDLVYSGNARSARKLLDLVYPGQIRLQSINQGGEVDCQFTKDEFGKSSRDN